MLVFVALAPCLAQAHEVLDPLREIKPFAQDVSRDHGLDSQRVESLLREARILPNVLAAIKRPAEAKPWRDYRPIFLTEQRITQGVEFWLRHAELVERASVQFGVDQSTIVAIIGVETLYGERAGTIRVLDALTTLGFRYPPRARFFRRELGHYLVVTQQENLDPTRVKGSYAGAMGIPQFIPSSYREYSVDFDGDGRRDLIDSVADAVGSVASYLARHGWVRGAPIAAPALVSAGSAASVVKKGIKPHSSTDELASLGIRAEQTDIGGDQKAALIELAGSSGVEYWLGFQNFYVITRYNHSQLYAMAVYQLASAIAARKASER